MIGKGMFSNYDVRLVGWLVGWCEVSSHHQVEIGSGSTKLDICVTNHQERPISCHIRLNWALMFYMLASIIFKIYISGVCETDRKLIVPWGAFKYIDGSLPTGTMCCFENTFV